MKGGQGEGGFGFSVSVQYRRRLREHRISMILLAALSMRGSRLRSHPYQVYSEYLLSVSVSLVGQCFVDPKTRRILDLVFSLPSIPALGVDVGCDSRVYKCGVIIPVYGYWYEY